MSVRVMVFTLLLFGLLGTVVGASTQQDLASAANQQKVAFILVTDQGATGADPARDLIGQAVNRVKKSILVELDRSKGENADLVAKFRLAEAPVPLILVAGRNGAPARAVPASQATVERLVQLAPSPKEAEILQALYTGRSVFVTVSAKKTLWRSTPAPACALICGGAGDGSVKVQIDRNDRKEAGFLKRMRVDLASVEPVNLTVDPQDFVTDEYVGATDVATILQVASWKPPAGCPGAAREGGKSCGGMSHP
jgi:hypothetical protein